MVAMAGSFLGSVFQWMSTAVAGNAHLLLPIAIALILLKLLSSRASRQRFLPWLLRLLAAGAVLYAIAFGYIWLYQSHFLYKPTHVLQTTPASHKLDFEEVWIPVNADTKRPQQLHSWWIPQPKNHLGTLLFFHGAGLNIGYNVSQANWFRWLGLDVLLVEYRGYGLSEGDFPTEASLYEDAEAALAYLTTEREIPTEEIMLYGHSLGGAIAINLAIHHPELAGLIVHNSFTSMVEMASFSNIARWFPVQLMLNQRFESLEKVRQLKMPKLFIHAIGDPRIPVYMGKRLYAAAPEPKELILMNLNNHENAAGVYKSKAHLDKLKQFAMAALQ